MSSAFDWIVSPWQAPLLGRGGLIAVIVGSAAAAAGCWVLLRDLPFAAESMSHGMFPGLIGAALLGVPLALGGLVGLAVSAAVIWTARRFIAEESHAVAIAIVPMLGLGAILALSGPVPPGTGNALFGDILATDAKDLVAAITVAVLIALALHRFHWRLLAAGVGGSRLAADALVLAMLAFATAAAARSLGALLAVALIIGPPVAARRLFSRSSSMVIASAAIAAVAVAVGVEAAWHLDVAAGPAIAICAIIPAAAAAAVRPASSLLTALR